jgi:hypothetical protein
VDGHYNIGETGEGCPDPPVTLGAFRLTPRPNIDAQRCVTTLTYDDAIPENVCATLLKRDCVN